MNIGGYTESDFNESDGISILKMKLGEKRTIFSHFTEQDKIPNTDGFFEILSKLKTKSIPRARFEVQIKSLDTNYINDNTKYNRSAYKYSCETKIFNAVVQGLFLNPAILFMVDVKNKKIFYKHVTFHYALSLDVDEKEKKVIYFNDDDELKDIDKFYQECNKIYSDKIKVLQSFEENKFVISPNLTQDELNILQEEFDYLNNIFDTDLKFIKKQLFQDLWKFGIAFVKNEKFISVGIYQIKYGKNDTFFGLLDKKLFRRCNFVSFNKSEKSIHEIINDFIGRILIDSYDKIIIPFETVSIDILNEIAFMFLDKISRFNKDYEDKSKPGVYYKDSEKVTILKHYYEAIGQYAFNELRTLLVNHQFNKEECFNVKSPLDKLSHLPDDNIERIKFAKLLHQNSIFEKPRIKFLFEGKFNYNLIDNLICELDRRKIDVVNRVWIPKNPINSMLDLKKIGIDRVEHQYILSDLYTNIINLTNKIVPNYKCVIKHFNNININRSYIFSFSQDEDYDMNIISYDSDDFYIKIDNDFCKIDHLEIFDRFGKSCVISSTICSRIFNLSLPLTLNILNLLLIQISKKYGITNYKSRDEIGCLMFKN